MNNWKLRAFCLTITIWHFRRNKEEKVKEHKSDKPPTNFRNCETKDHTSDAPKGRQRRINAG